MTKRENLLCAIVATALIFVIVLVWVFTAVGIDDDSGKKVFGTDRVPTEYIVGIGVNTTVAASVDDPSFIIQKFKGTLGYGTVSP